MVFPGFDRHELAIAEHHQQSNNYIYIINLNTLKNTILWHKLLEIA